MNTAPAEPSARGVHLIGTGPFIFPARPLSRSAPGTLPVLASEQGHEAALNLAGERQLNLFGESGDVSPEDLAFRLYLEHADVFMATHARVQSQEARRFVDFHPDARRRLASAEAELDLLLDLTTTVSAGRHPTGRREGGAFIKGSVTPQQGAAYAELMERQQAVRAAEVRASTA